MVPNSARRDAKLELDVTQRDRRKLLSKTPRLPPELERKIFEIAALTRPKRVPTFILGAKRVKYWIEPLLYRVVFVEGRGMRAALRDLDLPAFIAGAIQQRSHTCFQHVRHLFIDCSVDDALIKNWLLACTGITNLVAHFECTPEVLLSLSGFANLRYLMINERAFLTVHNGADSVATVPSPFFPALTHLELWGSGTGTLSHLYQTISLIPQLTHLALNPRIASRVSHPVLCANTQLRCIVFLFPADSLNDTPLVDDDRFVCIDEFATGYYVDWLRGAVFGEHYWSLADTFLAARRAGEIERSRYRISNGVDLADVMNC
ncbi:hypothetical protein C8R45DRAFT_1217277 [Mycena sanguinolenta]|nr:hypothetical protein C8R45DRAFT_1217277 [Mycena sanguinolenta]